MWALAIRGASPVPALGEGYPGALAFPGGSLMGGREFAGRFQAAIRKRW